MRLYDALGWICLVSGSVGIVCWRIGLHQGFEEGREVGHDDGERWLRKYQADQAMAASAARRRPPITHAVELFDGRDTSTGPRGA